MTLDHDADDTSPTRRSMPANDDLSRVVVLLLKGVLYRDADPKDWQRLVGVVSRARDHLAVLGLELVVDDTEGWAFVRSRRAAEDEEEEDGSGIPRLVVRRQLSFDVSLLVALLRRRLAEFDARGGDTRLVLTRSDLVDLLRVFLPDHADEARLYRNVDQTIGKVEALGFLRRVPSSDGTSAFEVRRIVKAFVDAQWLGRLSERLAEYREAFERDLGIERADG